MIMRVNLLCCFVPVAKWRKALWEGMVGKNRRYQRRLSRLQQYGDFHIVEIEGVKVAQGEGLNLGHIFDGDGILIVKEIFKNDEYHFDIGKEAVVIDIGMNIGLASLYFATREEVKAVYGFEPFKPTFEQAVFNFKINEKYARKIHSYNYGLGDSDKELSFDYSPRTPGRMSTVKTIGAINPSRKHETRTETVQIKNAATEIKIITERHRDQKIVLKCDVEGAEKEIFESLDAAGALKDIDVLMLEYHFSYDVPLLEMLKRNGFVYFKQKTTTLETGDFGMIRAVKVSLEME